MTEPRPLSGRIDDLPSLPVKEYGEGIGKRVIFGPGRFWEEYTVRFFTTAPGKKTPFHAHDWPHYVLAVEGRGRALIAGRTYELSAGSWAHVPANTDHLANDNYTSPRRGSVIVVDQERRLSGLSRAEKDDCGRFVQASGKRRRESSVDHVCNYGIMMCDLHECFGVNRKPGVPAGIPG